MFHFSKITFVSPSQFRCSINNDSITDAPALSWFQRSLDQSRAQQEQQDVPVNLVKSLKNMAACHFAKDELPVAQRCEQNTI